MNTWQLILAGLFIGSVILLKIAQFVRGFIRDVEQSGGEL